MLNISVQQLFDIHTEKLGLTWIAGHDGGDRVIRYDVIDTTGEEVSVSANPLSNIAKTPYQLLVGHLNLIHPHQVQILGYFETSYLAGLREISRQDALQQMFDHRPHCIIIAEDQEVPTEILALCNERNTPLFTSHFSSNKLSNDLFYFLSTSLATKATLHGVFMEVMAIGVLLTGDSGVGKSELALELINRGHRLVADDAPEFSQIAPGVLNGTCPEALSDFLEVRGLGIINVRQLFGDSAIKSNKYLKLIIHLERMTQDRLLDLDRLEGSYRDREILDVEVPEITIPVAPGRNLAVLVECAARNHILRISGFNSAQDFIERQRKLLMEEQE